MVLVALVVGAGIAGSFAILKNAKNTELRSK